MRPDELVGGEDAGRDDSVLVELGRLRGEVNVLRERLAAVDAAEEHHRVELDAARAEAAEAQAALREWQVKAEEWRRQLAETRRRLDDAEARCQRAEDERSAVIAALGRRARRQFESGSR